MGFTAYDYANEKIREELFYIYSSSFHGDAKLVTEIGQLKVQYLLLFILSLINIIFSLTTFFFNMNIITSLAISIFPTT